MTKSNEHEHEHERPCPKCGGTRRISRGRCADCYNRRQRERRAAARRGDAPDHDLTKPVPDGFHLRGASTLYDADGNVRLQWVKSQIDPENKIAGLIEAVEAMTDRLPVAEPIAAPTGASSSDLLAVYPMGDPHIGMYAWAEETGNDFDLEIAERTIAAAADHLVALAPDCEQALVINLGDFFHADNQSNQTSRGGHALDVDSRWAKVLRVGVRIMARLIDRALQKHRKVRVINAIGNHDDHTSVVLGVCLDHHYRENPRVEIDTSPAAFHYHRFGDCLIGVTHGHRAKGPALESIMAHDCAEHWSATQGRRYWYVGHIHHSSVQEYRNCVVESFRTLAARDAWHAAMGYRSGRDMRLDVLHRDNGRINRHIVGVEQLNTGRTKT